MSWLQTRRKQRRYCGYSLDCKVKPSGIKGLVEPMHTVAGLDFNRFGVAIESEAIFSMGQILQLELNHRSGISSQVLGVVAYVQQKDGFSRYGIKFIRPWYWPLKPGARDLIKLETLLADRLVPPALRRKQLGATV